MRVLSFGEQALGNAQSSKTLRQVVDQAGGKAPRLILVVSSLRGVRDSLVGAVEQAAEGSGGYLERIEAIREPVLEIIRELFGPREQSGVITAVQILLNDLEDILHGVQLIRECSLRTLDLVSSFAAQISCILISRYLEDHPDVTYLNPLISSDTPRSGKVVIDANVVVGIVGIPGLYEYYEYINENFEPIDHVAYSCLVFDLDKPYRSPE